MNNTNLSRLESPAVSKKNQKVDSHGNRHLGFWERNQLSNGHLLRKTIATIIIRFCRAALLFGMCFLILQPLLNKISVSFMAISDLFDATVIAIPRNFTLEHYALVDSLISYWPSLFRTIAIATLVAVLQVSSCALAGYGFARYKFPLKNLWFACVILIIIIPPQTILAPLYLNFRFFDIFGIINLVRGEPLNLLNDVVGYVVLAATGMGLKSGLYIFMLRQHFRGLPKELEEAAYVDGCGRLKTFLRIMLPDAKPMLTSCFLFSFVWQWTDSFYTTLFLMPYNVLSGNLSGLAERFREYYSLEFQSNPPIAYVQTITATGMLMSLLPLIFIYLVAQRAFVESLSHAGIKM